MDSAANQVRACRFLIVVRYWFPALINLVKVSFVNEVLGLDSLRSSLVCWYLDSIGAIRHHPWSLLASSHQSLEWFPLDNTLWGVASLFPAVKLCGVVHVFSLLTWTCTIHTCCNIISSSSSNTSSRSNSSSITIISQLIWVVCSHLNKSRFTLTWNSIVSSFSFMIF